MHELLHAISWIQTGGRLSVPDCQPYVQLRSLCLVSCWPLLAQQRLDRLTYFFRLFREDLEGSMHLLDPLILSPDGK